MNLITATAIYVGDTATESGTRTMQFHIKGTGNKPVDIPVNLVPSFAAGETCVPGAFETGKTILINGRLYPQENGPMYVVPTQPLQAVPASTKLNQILIAGGCWLPNEQRREDALNFLLLVGTAPPQKSIGHTWQDTLVFRMESWKDDAERLKKFLYKGRQLCLGGSLRFENWTGKDGNQHVGYKVRVRSNQYSFFGKNKKVEGEAKSPPISDFKDREVFESPHQQAIAKPKANVVEFPTTGKASEEHDDGIPF